MQASIRALVPALVLALAAATPVAGATAATYNVYWGDLHGHTMDSPVTLTTSSIDAYIRYARDTKALNFVALTEKDFDLSDSEWSDCRSRAAAFTSSSFVAFSAFEWGDKGDGDLGHRPVYYLTDDQPLFHSDQPGSDHVSELLDAVTSSTNGFTSVAHPDLSLYPTNWDYFDGTIDRTAEIYSRHGHFETGTHGIQQALAQGYRFGIVAVGDSRTGQPGEYGLTAVLSTSLGKSALHAAVKARRTYATSGVRILLQATMDGHQMGEEYTSSTGPTLSVQCTPTAGLESIEVLKNNSVVYTYPSAGAPQSLPASPWCSVPEVASAEWTASSCDDAGWKSTSLAVELEAPHKRARPLRLRQHLQLDAVPPGAILRTNLPGEYRLYLDGRLLVDTYTFRYDAPDHTNDCDAPDAHELVGTPEHFRRLGFYDLAALGGGLHAGDNVLALEYEPRGTQSEPPIVQVLAAPQAGTVSFTWADGAFTGPAFYYLRVTQSDGHQAWSSPWWVDRMAPDTTPPQVPARLRAHKDANDVYLDWTKVTKDINGNVETVSSYRIFRGTSSDFVPDRAGLSNQIGTTTKGRYRDSGALVATPDYYYRVVAVDAAGNESPSASNLAFMIHHPLRFHTSISNIYWLSLPYQAVYSTADQLARDLNRGTAGPCTKVARWEVAPQRPASWVYLGNQWMGSNFALSPGQGVAVTISRDMDALLVGAHDEGTTVRLTYNPGAPSLNWVGLPFHSPHQLAYQVVQDINNGYAPTTVTRIVRFIPDLQTSQTYQWTGSAWSGTNFVVLPGEAYSVEAQTTTDWPPDTRPLP